MAVTLYAELKPRLSVAQIIINVPKELRNGSNISLTSSGVELELEDGSIQGCLLLAETKFFPASCHALQWTGKQELHMRVEINTAAALFEESGLDVHKSDDTVVPPTANHMMDFRCAACGGMLIQQVCFQRVLPAPDDDLSELSESWFCHGHHSAALPTEMAAVSNSEAAGEVLTERSPLRIPSGDRSASTPADPGLARRGAGDCLLMKGGYAVPRGLVTDGGVVLSQAGCLRCRRCHAVVGRSLDRGIRTENSSPKTPVALLYHHQITWNARGAHVTILKQGERLRAFERIFVRSLLDEVKGQNCYRYLIEGRTPLGHLEPYILMWIMDTKCLIYTGHMSVTSSSRDVIQSRRIVKLLFTHCLTNKSLGQQWRRDLNVHSKELPESQCLHLLDTLLSRTADLPPTTAKVGGFYVSYLELR